MADTDFEKQDPFAEAGQQLQEFVQGPAQQAAEQLEKVFARAGSRIGVEMGNAARTGSFSFSKMVESILKDMARLAVKQTIGAVVSSVLNNFNTGSFSGARAEGGPVLGGGSYLVGERGPEIFTPTSAGTIEPPLSGGPITVNFHLGPGVNVDEFRRSQGQISTMLSRAVEQGRKRL